MANYRYSAQIISRSSGRSVVACSAYRAGVALTNERDGNRHDYSRRRHVEYSEVMTPANTPDWMSDRQKLWNAVEAVEKRKDAQLAREIQVALPRELDVDARRGLVRSFVQAQFVDKGMIADLAIHNPLATDGKEQPHAHILLTMRDLTGAGFGKKNRDWNDSGLLESWREAWADRTNRSLEQAGSSARVDHRSLEAQREEALERGDLDRADDLDREPEPKLGVGASAMERRGIATERGEELRATRGRNSERKTLRDRLQQVGDYLGRARTEIAGELRGAATKFQTDMRKFIVGMMGYTERNQLSQPGDGSHEGPGRHDQPESPRSNSTQERLAKRLQERQADKGQEPAKDISRDRNDDFER